MLKEKITNYYRNYEFVALRVRELNGSNLQVIKVATSVAPFLKYAIQGYPGLFPKDIFNDHDYMYNDSDWSYINSPKSIEFRLHEEFVYYYYIKQVSMKVMFVELLEQAEEIKKAIEKEIYRNG